MDWIINRRLEDSDGNGGLHIRAGLANSAWMEYEAHNLILHDDGESEPLKFIDKDNEVSNDIEKAEVLIKGSIKWDGCSHNNFCPPNGYIHACSRQEMVRLGNLFDKLYDIALELMPDNGDYLS